MILIWEPGDPSLFVHLIHDHKFLFFSPPLHFWGLKIASVLGDVDFGFDDLQEHE